ncbi:ABC transporter ATP-binding protein [Aridibaculum aurantiacum]|uniref:ABC transporter ATP-binding protein n=1 Tax=Aridibaculum aurantiacum TaxID=2810307 RepID=UPI001A979CA1|nr:ABC transporter ATP-binding protein [Aridibaculum aurantiacum]
MSKIAIKAENISKAYQLGEIGTGTLSRDLERWVAKLRGKEDPFLKLGEANDRTTKGTSNIVWSLKDINFEIEQGDAVGIIGRNGAGKSTLLKLLSRVTSPTTGKISGRGRIASLLEVGTGFHPELTGRENIYLNGAILGMRKKEIQRKFDEIVDFSGVERYIDTPVKRYSSGMYVRLAFAVAAHLESEILIVDEVLAVGDADFQKKCLGKMNEVSKGEGRTVLFVSHNMASIKNLCNTGILLKNGSIVSHGSIDHVVEFYLDNFKGFNTINKVIIDASHRIHDHSKDVEFIAVELLFMQRGNCISKYDPIKVKVTMKGHKEVNSFRAAMGVYSTDDTCVGCVFSEDILNIRSGETKEVLLQLNNHQLAKGQYYIDFSLGIGNDSSGIRDFDHIHKPLYFEVAFRDRERQEMIPLWMSQWGKINFESLELFEM